LILDTKKLYEKGNTTKEANGVALSHNDSNTQREKTFFRHHHISIKNMYNMRLKSYMEVLIKEINGF
jgi:hypothetical protein